MPEKRLFVIGFGQPASRAVAERGVVGGRAEKLQSNNTNKPIDSRTEETARKKGDCAWRDQKGDLVSEIREPATATAVSCGDDLTDFQSQSQDGNTAIFPQLPVGAAELGSQEKLGILGLPKIGNTEL